MEPPEVYYDDYGCCEDCDGYSSETHHETLMLSSDDMLEALLLAVDDAQAAARLEDKVNEMDYYDDYEPNAVVVSGNEKFDKMWPAVDLICQSLVSRPREWKILSYTIKHIPTGHEYWTGSGGRAPITQLQMNSGHTTVFSDDQGLKIRAALHARDIYNPSDEQLKIMQGFGVAPQPFKPEPGFFGRMWAAIKFFPILVKFCVGYRS